LLQAQGPRRLWEFHPDDVTSVGVYRGDGQMHEVIATLNRDFDVPEATSGLKELNERLSRELNATLTIEAEHFITIGHRSLAVPAAFPL
jgi:hypothetical protein